MSYNPGNSGVFGAGLQALSQGIAGGLNSFSAGIASGLDQNRMDRQEADQLRTVLGGPALAPGQEGPGALPTQGGLTDSLGDPEGPGEGTGEGGASEADKRAHKQAKALRDVGTQIYGYAPEELSHRSLGELRGLMQKETIQQTLREFELKQRAQRAQELRDQAMGDNIASEIRARDNAMARQMMDDRRKQNFNTKLDQLIGQPSGDMVGPPDPRAGIALPEILRAGAQSGVLTLDDVLRMAEKPMTPLDLAHIRNLDAKTASEQAAEVADNAPKEFNDSVGNAWIYNPRTGNYQRRDVAGFQQAVDETGAPVPGLGTLGGKVVKVPIAKDVNELPATERRKMADHLLSVQSQAEKNAAAALDPESKAMWLRRANQHAAERQSVLSTLQGAKPAPAPAPAAPAGRPGLPAAPGSAAPYPDGTRLNGPGGKRYVVRNGKPVPE